MLKNYLSPSTENMELDALMINDVLEVATTSGGGDQTVNGEHGA